MSALTDVLERARALLFRRRQERELDEEMRFHVERDTAERIRGGTAPDAARREALIAFGGVEQYKESVRDARGVRPLEELASDIRFALRGLRRNPGFTATALLVLGLGIGATTAVFSVMQSVVFAPLPYPDPDRLVTVVEQTTPTNRWNISTADATAIREQQHSFEAWGEITRGEAALSGAGAPERIALARASAGYFRAVAVPVALGRPIEAPDEGQDAPAVLVLTDAMATRLYGAAAKALGQQLMLDGVSHHVIGVLPAGREELGGVRVPAWSALKLRPPTRRGPFWLRGLGRLKPGVTVEMARSDLAAISRRILTTWSDFNDSTARLTPYPLRDYIVGRVEGQAGLFAGAVLLVLLLAVTNVATLVLVRASARESEVAVRVMLGAGRARIARLLVTENLALTLGAGALGLLLAFLGVKLAVAQLAGVPRIQTVALDWRAGLFALAVSLLSGVLVSLSPVATLSRRSLRDDARRAGTSRRTNAVRAGLVIAEFALALPLLVGAGLLLNSFVRLSRVNPGFDPSGVYAAEVALPQARYPTPVEFQRFWQQAEARLTEVKLATTSGLVSDVPPDNSGNYDNFNLVDHPVPAGGSEPASPWYYVTSGYFAALGVPLLEGRLFTVADSGNAAPSIVVSRAWAAKYFPRGESPVGRQLVQGGCYNCPRTTIVGVVADIKNLGLAAQEEAVYGPVTQSNNRSMHLVIRSAAGPAAALRSLREVVQALDPELPVREFSIAERFDDSLSDPRRWTSLLGAFAVTGTALAALGIFGLMSYVVRQRRREIGVRLALGAAPQSVTRLIIGRGMRYAVAGSSAGLLLTLLLARRLNPLLFGVGAQDAVTIGAVAAVLLAVAFVACWIPGRRAAGIPAVEAINAE